MKPPISYVLLLLIQLFLLNVNVIQASDTITLYKDEEIEPTGSYLDIFEDPEGKLSIAQVSSKEFENQFILNTRQYPYTINENINSVYWLRLRIDGSQASHAAYVVQFYNPTISSITIYRKDLLGKFVSFHGGNTVPFKERDIDHSKISFVLPINNSVQTVYFRVFSDTYSGFSMRLLPARDFISFSLKEYYVEGLFLGLILIMVIYNLMIFVSTKEKIYLYYCSYALACALYTLNYSRIGFHLIWSDFPQLNQYASTFISIGMLTAFFLYASSLLRLQLFFPRTIRIFNYVILSVIALSILRKFFWQSTWLTDLLFYSCFLFIYILSFLIVKRGYRPARYFFAGFSFIVLSFIIRFIETIDLSIPTILTTYSLQISFIFEIMIFSFALASRLGVIKKEKEQALQEKNNVQRFLIEKYKENELLKDKVNRELEAKVDERTQELNQKNEELKSLYLKVQEQSEMLKKWNIELDLDNRKLSDEIKNVVASKVLVKNVEFEDFNKIFPDDLSCYRFLEELKWGKGFMCTKCGNEKYFETKTLFSRKCTRCRHEESVINNTIFQGSKIPISKQFYMLFLIYSSKGKLTSTELSETLSMRLKTCWTFHKKVKEIMKQHSWEELDGWDSLILLKGKDNQDEGE